jgi:hypothetical protein
MFQWGSVVSFLHPFQRHAIPLLSQLFPSLNHVPRPQPSDKPLPPAPPSDTSAPHRTSPSHETAQGRESSPPSDTEPAPVLILISPAIPGTPVNWQALIEEMPKLANL